MRVQTRQEEALLVSDFDICIECDLGLMLRFTIGAIVLPNLEHLERHLLSAAFSPTFSLREQRGGTITSNRTHPHSQYIHTRERIPVERCGTDPH
jgi:hypothetical protein